MVRFFVFFALSTSSALAAENQQHIKAWKTFESDAGYRFKYPDCWEVKVGDVAAVREGPMEVQGSIFVQEGAPCVRPPQVGSGPNGVSFDGGWGPKNKRVDAKKELALRERNAPVDLERKKILFFKHFKQGNNDAIAWVEDAGRFIRWEYKFYCPDWWITVTGPGLEKSKIDKTLLDKLKNGDEALPEPEKTIIESLRCIPAKLKERKPGY